MPRYFFHVRTHSALIIDEEGLDLDSLDVVRAQTLAGAKELIKLFVDRGQSVAATSIEVADESGAEVAHLYLTSVIDGSP